MNLGLDDWRVWMDAKIINEDEMQTEKTTANRPGSEELLALEDLRLIVLRYD